jgi:hypothetical protein
MDDRIRISDADRDRVTGRLREHFAEGRLTPEELDERIAAALNAKTFGDLRQIMADLPEPAAAAPFRPRTAPQMPPRSVGPLRRFGGRPRIAPVVLLALLAALLIPGGGWVFASLVKVVLVFFLVSCLAGILLASHLRRRIRAGRCSGYAQYGGPRWPGGYAHHARRHWHW